MLCACDQVGAPERMSLADARANVSRLATSGSAHAFCTSEGQLEFRRAVRALSAAHEAENQRPVEMLDTSDQVWGLVLLGVMAGIVEPSDLNGEMASMASVWRLSRSVIADVRVNSNAMESACPELITVYRQAAEVARIQELYQRRSQRGDRSNLEQLSERLARANARLQSATERLQRKLEANGATL